MNEKTLDQAERDLLAIIDDIRGHRAAADRNRVNVEARGRGIEVGRVLAALKDAGLVEEFEDRPGFLRRLFGAKTRTMLRPTGNRPPAQTETGAQTGGTSATAEVAAPESPAAVAPDAPAPAAAPAPDTSETRKTVEEAETSSDASAEPKSAQAPQATPKTSSETPAEAPAAKPGSVSNIVSAAVAARVASPAAAAAAPAPAPAAAPAATPALPVAPVETPAAPARPAPVPAARHFAADAYTLDLGGGPADLGDTAADPGVIEDLRETLAGFGMELTMAGETLIADRMAKGSTSGDALAQVALYAFAHAVHYDLLDGGGMLARGLTDYAIEVMRELEKLRDAGAIDPDRFESDMRSLWAVVEDSPERGARAAEMLQDPIGGAAPPALLPEDLREAEDIED